MPGPEGKDDEFGVAEFSDDAPVFDAIPPQAGVGSGGRFATTTGVTCCGNGLECAYETTASLGVELLRSPNELVRVHQPPRSVIGHA